MNKPKKYKQKQLVFEAVQFTGANLAEIKEFCGRIRQDNDKVIIKFNEGVEFELKPNHWIIKDQFGEFASASDRFLNVYEEHKEDA